MVLWYSTAIHRFLLCWCFGRAAARLGYLERMVYLWCSWDCEVHTHACAAYFDKYLVFHYIVLNVHISMIKSHGTLPAQCIAASFGCFALCCLELMLILQCTKCTVK